MTSVAKCLVERGVADTKHTQAMRNLAVAVANDTPNRRTIAKGVKQVEDMYEVLIDKHVGYVLKLGASTDNVDHQGWINGRGDNNQAALEDAQVALDLIDAGDNGGVPVRNIDVVREDIDILTLTVNAKLAALQAAVAHEVNQQQYEVLSTQVMELEQLLTSDYRDLSRELREVDAANQADLRDEHRAYQAQKIPLLETVRTTLAGKM